MAHRPRYPDPADAPDRAAPRRAPRWVPIAAIIALILVLLFVVMMAIGGGGGHGPARHLSGTGREVAASPSAAAARRAH